ncbi:MAG: hypothetical protein QOK13_1286 [Gaiellaceae bacterium]|nr:hypothetical protein [Gaiellaceae bacterium]
MGLFLFAAGVVALLESKLGLSPWDVLNQGIARHSPLSFGLANIAVGLVVLVLAWTLGGPPGLGTVANAVLIGLFIEALLRVDAVVDLAGAPLGLRVALLPLGIALMGIGSGFYICASYGAGPRDTLMLVLSRRTGRRIGLVRAGIEACALVAGFILGGTVGIGTLAFALLIGPAVEASFWLLAHSPLVAQQGLCGSEPQSP